MPSFVFREKESNRLSLITRKIFMGTNYESRIKTKTYNTHSHAMMTSSNGNIFRVTSTLCGEFTGNRRIPRKGQGLGALMFSLICAWINGLVNNREAGELRRHRAHYGVIVMQLPVSYDILDLYFITNVYVDALAPDDNGIGIPIIKIGRKRLQSHLYNENLHTWKDDLYTETHIVTNRITWLTHWGQETLISVDKQTIIGSDNGLAPFWRQAII